MNVFLGRGRGTLSAFLSLVAALALPEIAGAAETVSYDLNYAAHGQMAIRAEEKDARKAESAAAPSAFAYQLEMRVRGSWVTTPLRQSGTENVIRCRLDKPDVSCAVNGRPIPAPQRDALRRDLMRETAVVLSREGSVRRIAFDAIVLPASRNVIKTLLSLSQFARPATPGNSSWRTQEESRGGVYAALYTRPGGAGQTIVKTVTAAPDAAPPDDTGEAFEGARAPVASRPQGRFVARLDAEGRLLSLDGTLTETQTLAGKPLGQTVSRLTLRRRTRASAVTATEQTARNGGMIEAGRFWTTLRRREADPEAEQRYLDHVLGGATTGELFEELGRVSVAPVAGVKNGERVTASAASGPTLYPRLRALLIRHPETSAAAGARMAACAPDSPAFGVLLSALASAGHSQAQIALIAALEAQIKARNFIAALRLIPVLGRMEQVTPESEQTLRRWAASPAALPEDRAIVSTARLALGAATRRLSLRAPERADALTLWLCNRLRYAPERERQDWLRALGNAARPAALPFVWPFLSDAAPQTRAAAVAALRGLSSPEAAARLRLLLRSDPEAAVRREAAFALSFHALTLPAYQMESRVFADDADATVRVTLLENLWKARDRFPAVRALTQAAQSDAEPAVQETARRLLAAP